jgi:hypothetical protein
MLCKSSSFRCFLLYEKSAIRTLASVIIVTTSSLLKRCKWNSSGADSSPDFLSLLPQLLSRHHSPWLWSFDGREEWSSDTRWWVFSARPSRLVDGDAHCSCVSILFKSFFFFEKHSSNAGAFQTWGLNSVGLGVQAPS